MISAHFKRTIRNRFASKTTFSKSLFTKLPAYLALLSTLIFCIVQLAINANLNPKGAKLEMLNTEKNRLVEENRQLSEDIAQSKSLTIVSEISTKKLSLQDNPTSNVVYISDPSIVASAQ